MTIFRQQTVVAFLSATVILTVGPSRGFAQYLTGYQPQGVQYAQADTRLLTSSAPAEIANVSGNVNNEAAERSSEAPVDLSADTFQHDEQSGIVTASGNVELVQGKRILRADTVSYNINTDTVIARGNVSLNEPNGDIHFAEEVQLSDEMRNGFVKKLQSYLSNGGYFTAEEGERISEKLITMRDATYTPCECEEDKDGNPTWQIRAEEVTLDEEAHKVKYKNARFEIFGVPVAWTPYLAHPDGKVKRKSGFMTPQVGYDSQLGFLVTQNYYYDIAPDKDMTIGTMLTTKENPVALVEYRQRFAQADLQIEGSATKSSRSDSIGGQEVITDDELRGHLFADSRWSINEKYRAGLNLELTSDDQYLRQYDFSGKDVLENEIFVERFAGRNYAVGRVLAFQDLRVEEERTDQPNVLPELELNFLGEPNKTLGGRWEAQASLLQLQRNSGQDMVRVVGRAGWERRLVTDYGLTNTLELSARGDAYWADDRDVAVPGSGRSKQGVGTRFLPRAHLVSSYPLVKPMTKVQAIVEPVAALTIAPDVDDVDSDIPNEDSQDVQLDASNLFEPGRFPGKDRLEDGSRATYGLRSGLYGYGGSFGKVFLGQSYRLDNSENPFSQGSGLEERASDWVGQVAGVFNDRYGLNYRFQLDGKDFGSRRHEVDGFTDFGRLDLSARYLFAKGLGGTDISESREQLYAGASYDLTRSWRMRGSVLEDLGQNPGLREATFGLDYTGCCLSFSATVNRSITSDVSGDSGTDIKFRIGLKGIGDFANSEATHNSSQY